MMNHKRCHMSEKRHPGITMHKISFGGGFMGLLFAAGSALIFVLGFPTLWYFVALAAALGIGIAVFLNRVSNWRSNRNQPLSILAAPQDSRDPLAEKRDQKGPLLQATPRFSPV
jgi:hypothetical protein